MVGRFLVWWVGLTLLLHLHPTAEAGDILPFRELREGMAGYCETVFKGTRLDRFEVRVLGKNPSFFGPGKGLVFLLGDDFNVNFTGVAAGMSGSPVYIGGKLAGALAYKLAFFEKRPLFGMQPIEEMLKDLECQPDNSVHPSLLPGGELANFADEADLLAYFGARFKSLGGPGLSLAKPLLTQFETQGLSRATLTSFNEVFRHAGVELASGGGGADSEWDFSYPMSGGYPLSAGLIWGDLDIRATGTITHAEGERLLAFGHPFFGTGHANFALRKAAIVYTVPSAEFAFKLSAAGPIVGTVIGDRHASIVGVVGPPPPAIRVRVKREGFGADRPELNFEVTRNVQVADLFLVMGLRESLISQEALNQETTLESSFDLHFQGRRDPFHLEFQDSFKNGPAFPLEMAAILVDVFQKFRHLGLDLREVSAIFRQRDGFHFRDLEAVTPEKILCLPEETVRLSIDTLDKKNGRRELLTVPVLLPGNRRANKLQITIMDGVAQNRLDRQFRLLRPELLTPESYLEFRASRHKRNHIVIQGRWPRSNLVYQGRETGELPSSLASVIENTPRSESREAGYQVAFEQKVECDFAVNGSLQLQLELREKLR